MLFHLVKKDFLLVKKQVQLLLVIGILLPPFLLWRVPEIPGPMSFCLSVIFSFFTLLQYVLQKENQYPRASELLCASPCPRKLLVLSKYMFCLIIYAACCVIFFIETLVFPELGTLQFGMPTRIFFVISVSLSLYLPVQYKFGYEKTKFIFMIIIMASPFILPQLLKMNQGFRISLLNALPPDILYGGIFLISLLIFAVSAKISIAFYEKMDLA
ncbi:MAG: ABC-2 transporter permease [Lachnospiraceae bacterium]|nr:ABC-2 transporter permease [Lachnospiraceae bacterium]